jgi:pimeloyl-ACP methyl ester carboxylesterase
MTEFASVPGARLAYDVAGAGDPPMIFVHGQTVGAGHFIQLEVPEQVNAMIERFLAITDRPAPP